ncbi:hypothetical protein J2S13_001940 [Oikeobacillus pervagus]|uniref:NosL protein n=1 Tax=Oikeobacillus pervagus TaxID=1325931 RepID=A0AAJ1WGV6_9BACI|nr:nitrous oxide reductase accessory protein NosL [Oikeobacillus pervagus]MDQ0215522.1 hypothetical protein [Oikeobacillus pervagus]
MKKQILLGSILTLALGGLAGCSEDTAKEPKDNMKGNKQEVAQKEETTNKKTEAVHEHGEPNEHTTCAFCDMKVYMKDEDMGQFTAKLVTEDNETLFFDDVGCLLNYERDMEGKAKERYVRDYQSTDWVKVDDSTVAKADIKTPMNYGYAFFAKKEDGQKFIDENEKIHAKEATWKEIDEVALQRYMKKKQMQKNGDGQMDHHNMDNGSSNAEEKPMQH